MTVTRRDLLKMAGAAGVMGMAPPSCARRSWKDQGSDRRRRQAADLLPAAIHRRSAGLFQDEGLDVSIADFAGGSKALQAVVGGSADVVSGAFEHTLAMQSKGQFYRAFALQAARP